MDCINDFSHVGGVESQTRPATIIDSTTGVLGGGDLYFWAPTVECVVLYGVPNLRYSIKGASMGRLLLLPPGREWNPRQHGSDAIGSPEFESFKNSI